jgi:hypothetical protein
METREELGRAVSEALGWLDVSPEAAAAALGMNATTVGAMARGIVPMRSLVIKFATGVLNQAERRRELVPTAHPDWWSDVDAWLHLAGYEPRRMVGPATTDPTASPPPVASSFRPVRQVPGRQPAPAPGPVVSSQTSSAVEPRAAELFRPRYERRAWGASYYHVFLLVDQHGTGVFEIDLAANVDYRARAAVLKRDLETLPVSEFERRYARYRSGPSASEREAGDRAA